MKYVAVTLIAVLVASVAAAQSAVPRLTLDEAVEIALQHNRSLENADLQSQKAGEDVETARSHRFPRFSIEAQVAQLLRPVDVHFKEGTFGTFAGIGPVPASDMAITTGQKPTMFVNAQVAQPLTQLFRLNLGVRLSETSRDVELERQRAARLDVVNSVRQLYYRILQTESALDAAGQTIALLREVNRIAEERLVRQVVLKTDALTSTARLADAEHRELTLGHALAAQKEQLNQLLGRDVRTAFETDGPSPPAAVLIDHETALGRALEARPDVKEARLRLEQAELARRMAKTDSIPEVSLALSYLSPLNIDGAPRQIATVGLQLEWEPFDWGRRGRSVATKELAVRQARNAVRDAEDRAILEINASRRRVEEAQSRLRVARLTQDAARETTRVRAAQFKAQAALLSDVLSADASMAEANNDYQQALLAIWQAGADYERALGQEVTP